MDSAPGEFGENAIRQMQLPVKEGGFGFHSHSLMDLHKFSVASAVLAGPTVEAAAGFALGQNLNEEVESLPPSDRVLANSVHLLERAGIPAPDFAQAGPAEADVYLASVAKRFGELNRFALQDRFSEANDTDSQARLLSCGGIGAQWLVSLPADPRLSFTDDDFVSVVRLRLGFDVFTEGRCPHVNTDGVQCQEVCDRKGKHLFKCQTGGGWIMAHDGMLS